MVPKRPSTPTVAVLPSSADKREDCAPTTAGPRLSDGDGADQSSWPEPRPLEAVGVVAPLVSVSLVSPRWSGLGQRTGVAPYPGLEKPGRVERRAVGSCVMGSGTVAVALVAGGARAGCHWCSRAARGRVGRWMCCGRGVVVRRRLAAGYRARNGNRRGVSRGVAVAELGPRRRSGMTWGSEELDGV